MEQPYKVWYESRGRLHKAVLATTVKHNKSGNYSYPDAQIFIKCVDCELERQHNEFTTNGMRGLTSTDSTNKLLALQANRPITW